MELEAAAIDEYCYLGNPIQELGDLRSPYGDWLFPHAVPEDKPLPYPTDALFSITRQDVREELQDRFGGVVTDEGLR